MVKHKHIWQFVKEDTSFIWKLVKKRKFFGLIKYEDIECNGLKIECKFVCECGETKWIKKKWVGPE